MLLVLLNEVALVQVILPVDTHFSVVLSFVCHHIMHPVKPF